MVLSSLIYNCPPGWVSPAEKLMQEKGEIQPVTDLDGSEICRFFQGKKVLVTGATGFLGKLLVEKLLRTCDLEMIYLLVREKRGVDVTDRLNKLYAGEVFGPLRKFRPDFQRKIWPIKGDISRANLDLDPIDEDLLRTQVNVIFHVAATVNFDEKLSLATLTNVRGTRDLLRLAARCEIAALHRQELNYSTEHVDSTGHHSITLVFIENLVSFVYVSTAFCNCTQTEIEERIYEPPIGADELIDWVSRKSEDEVLAGSGAMMRDWPNSYTFTKAVAENAVRTYGKGLPVCVFRPTVVVSTYREPLRSWTDNSYGGSGIVVSSGIGLMRTIRCKQENRADAVPGDFVTNAMIAAAYVTGKERQSSIPVYNFASSPTNFQSFSEYMRMAAKYGIHNPSIHSVWINCLNLNRSEFARHANVLFLEILPNLLMDLWILITGGEPKVIKMYQKVAKFRHVVEYFGASEWKFHTTNIQGLWAKISGRDKEIFPFDMNTVDWEEFHVTLFYGLRKYIIKDDPSTIAAARQKLRRLSILHVIVKSLFYLGILIVGLWICSKLL